jgi:pyruvate/2-oxoglutarate dehydrogenase complex dihydrolipoamide dehydrogenase (E3) component
VLVDRIPVAGGVHGWDTRETRSAEAAVRSRGGILHLGETAVRWDGEQLLVMGQEGARRIAARALVVAAGSRPLGRAELGLAGPRPAGILAATVACHLSETGLLAGRRPAVVGGGDWAARAVGELLHAGAEQIQVVAPEGILRRFPESPAVTMRTASPVAVEGGPRVSALRLQGGERVECDALVLAHGLVPLRNVDGAVWEGTRTVYAQPAGDPATVSAAQRAGAAAAAEVEQLLEPA